MGSGYPLLTGYDEQTGSGHLRAAVCGYAVALGSVWGDARSALHFGSAYP